MGATSLRNKKVLAVEGKDEKNFFDAILKHLGIHDILIEDVMGKTQFKDKLPALIKRPDLSNSIELLAIIRDADENAQSTFDSVYDVVANKLGYNPPNQTGQFSEGSPKIGIFIMPGNAQTGMLEDLCLQTVQEHPAMQCVNLFSECVSHLSTLPDNWAKTKAQTFLAAMPEIVNSVGLGAQKGYWNFDSHILDPLRIFLEQLR